METLSLAFQYLVLEYGPAFATCAAIGTVASLVFLGRATR
jgi:hypothetical protein